MERLISIQNVNRGVTWFIRALVCVFLLVVLCPTPIYHIEHQNRYDVDTLFSLSQIYVDCPNGFDHGPMKCNEWVFFDDFKWTDGSKFEHMNTHTHDLLVKVFWVLLVALLAGVAGVAIVLILAVLHKKKRTGTLLDVSVETTLVPFLDQVAFVLALVALVFLWRDLPSSFLSDCETTQLMCRNGTRKDIPNSYFVEYQSAIPLPCRNDTRSYCLDAAPYAKEFSGDKVYQNGKFYYGGGVSFYFLLGCVFALGLQNISGILSACSALSTIFKGKSVMDKARRTFLPQQSRIGKTLNVWRASSWFLRTLTAVFLLVCVCPTAWYYIRTDMRYDVKTYYALNWVYLECPSGYHSDGMSCDEWIAIQDLEVENGYHFKDRNAYQYEIFAKVLWLSTWALSLAVVGSGITLLFSVMYRMEKISNKLASILEFLSLALVDTTIFILLLLSIVYFWGGLTDAMRKDCEAMWGYIPHTRDYCEDNFPYTQHFEGSKVIDFGKVYYGAGIALYFVLGCTIVSGISFLVLVATCIRVVNALVTGHGKYEAVDEATATPTEGRESAPPRPPPTTPARRALAQGSYGSFESSFLRATHED
eukprot:TRINITY_DN1630_c0_g1_i1.p1 TRINITY_DN1630_c0_g1~~TRINITY_DN1630_c0_g1_i1.p1  ORF type:complete len:590 (-),score=119.60 TRINITY_DN1630_c0_g1_i1:1067-2836(-)